MSSAANESMLNKGGQKTLFSRKFKNILKREILKWLRLQKNKDKIL